MMMMMMMMMLMMILFSQRIGVHMSSYRYKMVITMQAIKASVAYSRRSFTRLLSFLISDALAQPASEVGEAAKKHELTIV